MDAELQLRGANFDITVPLGDGGIRPTAGGVVVSDLPRAEREALTQIEGEELVRLDVPAFFDGWGKGRSRREPHKDIEPHVMQIIGLCQIQNGRLPHFKATGPMLYSGRQFVMDRPEWGQEARDKDGTLVRQEMVLKLVEFNDPDTINPHKRRKQGRKGGSENQTGGTDAPRTIKLQAPETLLEIASHYLGEPGRAKEIGKLNGIRDMRQKIPAGRRIKLPGG